MGIFDRKKRSLFGIGSLENESKFGRKIRKRIVYNFKSLEIKNEYSKSYNQISSSNTPHFASFHLIGLKNEFEVQISKTNESIEYLQNRVEELLAREDEFDKKEIIRFLLSRLNDSDNSALVRLIKEYTDSIDEFTKVNFPSIINNAQNALKKRKKYQQHYEVLQELIPAILENGYPKALEIDTDKEIEDKAEQQAKGRPLDDSAPQEEIKKVVGKYAQLKEFQNKSGKPKPTSIRDEIFRTTPEIFGELSDRAAFDRVKKAINELMQ